MMISRWLSAFLSYLRAPLSTRAEECDAAIREEFAFHLSQRTQDYAAEGLSESEARQAALRQFGDSARIAADCRMAALTGQQLWHRLHLALTICLTVGVASHWWISRHDAGDTSGENVRLPTAIASMIDNDWTGDVTGRVLDENGRPLDRVHVLVVVKTWPDHSYFQRAYTVMTSADGRYAIEDVYPVNDQYEVQIATVADHRVLKSAYHSQSGGRLEPVIFELPPSSSFALRVEAEPGTSVSGVEVFPHQRTDSLGGDYCVYFDSAGPIIRRTDTAGRVELPYYHPGETATVYLRPPQGDWMTRDVVVPEIGQVAVIRTASPIDPHPEGI